MEVKGALVVVMHVLVNLDSPVVQVFPDMVVVVDLSVMHPLIREAALPMVGVLDTLVNLDKPEGLTTATRTAARKSFFPVGQELRILLLNYR